MDLVKIGKYIAEKRKEKGMTQKQLAEKLNMSDKSVSKWERGICLPDAAVYMEICEILEISINEFFAGENISPENMITKSEDNLIRITKDSTDKQKSLKKIIAVMTVVSAIALILLGTVLFHKLMQPKNYMEPVDRTSVEMKTAEMLSGTDGAFLFKFFTKDKFKTMTLYLSEYQSGKLLSKNKVTELIYDGIDSATNGMLAVVPDFEKFHVKVIVTDDYAKYSTDFPILENVNNREYYGRSSTQIEDISLIQPGTEQGLMALIYGKNELQAVPVDEISNLSAESVNDYIYYLSFQFNK